MGVAAAQVPEMVRPREPELGKQSVWAGPACPSRLPALPLLSCPLLLLSDVLVQLFGAPPPHRFLAGVLIAVCLQSGPHGIAQLLGGVASGQTGDLSMDHAVSCVVPSSLYSHLDFGPQSVPLPCFPLVWCPVDSCNDVL